ncbi:DUF1613-domain-containing protein, partial [Myriangium duriaei CBS 260.36]
WNPAQWTPSSFAPSHYLAAMLNLIRNPNITSSHLFRADILYDSDADSSIFTYSGSSSTPPSTYVRHLKPAYKPLPLDVSNFVWRRTLVRELVPRNRQVDSPMVQTCHVFDAGPTVDSAHQTTLIFYLPHIQDVETMPFYHPKVKGICFAHTCLRNTNAEKPESPPAPQMKQASQASSEDTPGSLALYLLPFGSAPLSTLQPKISRTTARLLQNIHKLSRGVKDGYKKRVHHDLIVPQRRFQETYARLKEGYAKQITSDWREQTDPGKHVFEDLAIAAFFVELWREMYGIAPLCERAEAEESSETKFPGFVDIGCGNGLLVYLLRSEGYNGWGFDVRARKSWDMYPNDIQAALEVKTLVPSILNDRNPTGPLDERLFSGPLDPGVFIISNHADELTAWTPLLSFLNNSPFAAIPCCSHDLGGQRFRAPKNLRAKTQPSAYAALCNYVSLLANEVGYEAETEMLRIPSTRNACIVGR